MSVSTIVTIVIILLYVYFTVSTILVVLLDNRNPIKALSWILVLVFLPILGMLIYVTFGEDYRKRKLISRKSTKKIINYQTGVLEDIPSFKLPEEKHYFSKLIRLLETNSETGRGYANNKLDVFSEGSLTFESIFADIEKATDHIHIEFFIFEDDEISNTLRELLIKKARANVRVRMIYDYWGSFNLSKKYLQSLKDAGVYVKPFLPFTMRFGRSKINYRNHRKLIVVDGKIGYTGGLNVADRYVKGSKLGQWRDTMVRIEGIGVHSIQSLFLVDWYFVERKAISDIKYYPTPLNHEKNLLQVIASGPDTDWQTIMQGIATAIMSAKKYVDIHTPYFMPNETMLGCIQMASMSGVKISLMIPAQSDSRISDFGTESYLEEVLEAGVHVYRYTGGMLHSKAIVVDDYLSIIGSSNMDYRSFEQNFETNTFIYEEETALTLKKLFLSDLDKCEKLTLKKWKKRPRHKKIKESFARLFSPLM